MIDTRSIVGHCGRLPLSLLPGVWDKAIRAPPAASGDRVGMPGVCSAGKLPYMLIGLISQITCLLEISISGLMDVYEHRDLPLPQ